MRGTLEVALKAYFHPRHQHCTVEAQKAEKALSTVSYIYIFITWQALRAGSMQRILCSDWLPEQARWSDTARPGLPISFPQIKFHQCSSECTKVVSLKLLSAKVKRSFVIIFCLYGTRKSVNKNENKEKNVDKF